MTEFSVSSAKQTVCLVYNFFGLKGLCFGKLAEKCYRTLHSMEGIATKQLLLCKILLKCLFMSYADPNLGC